MGPLVSYFGIARADNTVIEQTGTTAEGIPYFVRTGGSGFMIIVEGRPGENGQPVALSTFDETLRDFPDLQIVASRMLGDGSPTVCDISRPAGGVPSLDPPDFSPSREKIAVVNDFACRFRDGQGQTLGVDQSEDACTQFASGEFGFVNVASTAQFCGTVTHSFVFPEGDTILTARLRDHAGSVGPAAQIMVRILPPPTPLPSATPLPTRKPSSLFGPEVTFLGIARADGVLIEPVDEADDGTPIYTRRSGFGFTLVVEGKPGRSGAAVSPSTYQEDLVTYPDIQIQTSRDLGNGSGAVCDITQAVPGATPVLGGGVPATDPADFSLTQRNIDAVNDFACRFRDGQDRPNGRTEGEACVLFPNGEYGYAEPTSTLQFCAFIDSVLAFSAGDTRLTVQLRDVDGFVGDPVSIILRVL